MALPLISLSTLVSGCVCLCGLASLVAGQGLTFTDVTNSSNVAVFTDRSTFGSGLCVSDFDADGDLDLVVPSRPGFPITYWRNEGNMVFSDQTAQAGLGNGRICKSVTAADVDNDGDQDLYVANWRSPPQLFINDGNAVFVDEAPQRGLTHVTSAYATSFGDFDRDGWLDLYVGNRIDAGGSPFPGAGELDILYRNTGGGQFVDVTNQAGLLSPGLTFAGGFFDYDEDGWPDLFAGYDKGAAATPNDLFRNLGNGSFQSVARALRTDIGVDAMGWDYADVFNDGGVDFYVSDSPVDHLFQVWEPTSQVYVNATSVYGLERGGTGWHVHFADFDLDGFEDLFVTQESTDNLLFLNPGTPAANQVVWQEVADAANCARIPTIAGTVQFSGLLADLDNDGDVDIVNRLAGLFGNGIAILRNDLPPGNHLRVLLEGTASNRDARGALLEAEISGMTMRRWVKSGTGFQSDSDRRPLFGLGAATIVDRLSIRWPSGTRQTLLQVAGNQTLSIREASFESTGTPSLGSSMTLGLRSETDVGATSVILLSAQETPHTLLPDGTELPLTVDSLAIDLLAPGNGILSGAIGTVDQNGRAEALLQIPNVPSLLGLQLFSTAFTIDPQNPLAVRTSFGTPLRFTLQ